MVTSQSTTFGGYRGRPHRRIVGWWALTMLGCLALVIAPQLPWTTSSEGDSSMAVNGFDNASYISAPGDWLTQIESLSIAAPDTTSEDDASANPVVPSLSNIPLPLSGDEVTARWGIFMLVLGAIAFFTAMWTAAGDVDRRRSSAHGVFVLGALSLVPAVHQVLSTPQYEAISGSSQTAGVGVFLGVFGAVAVMVGSVLLSWRLRPYADASAG